MYKADAKIENPNEVLVTVKITMTLSEWTAFREQLGSERIASMYPFWKLKNSISEVIRTVAQTFHAPIEEDE